MSDKKNLKIVENKTATEEEISENEKACINDTEQAPPSNVYQVIMSRMTPEHLAAIGTQLVQVNGTELFWMTSVGQLYPFNSKAQAIQAEYNWLMSKPN